MISMKYRLTIGESPDSGPAHPALFDYEQDHPTREAAQEAAQEQNDGRRVQWHDTGRDTVTRAQLSRHRVAEIDEQNTAPPAIYVSTSML